MSAAQSCHTPQNIMMTIEILQRMYERQMTEIMVEDKLHSVHPDAKIRLWQEAQFFFSEQLKITSENLNKKLNEQYCNCFPAAAITELIAGQQLFMRDTHGDP